MLQRKADISNLYKNTLLKCSQNLKYVHLFRMFIVNPILNLFFQVSLD